MEKLIFILREIATDKYLSELIMRILDEKEEFTSSYAIATSEGAARDYKKLGGLLNVKVVNTETFEAAKKFNILMDKVLAIEDNSSPKFEQAILDKLEVNKEKEEDEFDSFSTNPRGVF